MKLKHFLIIGFAIAIVSIGFVSAADDDVSMLSALDITPFSEDTTVTIDGIDFNVPKGYGEQKDIRKENDTVSVGLMEVTLSNYQYLNEDGDLLNLQVLSTKDNNFTTDSLNPNEDGFSKKTINDTEGFYSESDGVATFIYAQDGKSVQITGNSDVISKVIK
ncbi:hypothetical protein [Methanobrevibacter sp.]|uniref:hypothetical protein n=1 Tax=Methanobrevibacter sp. TaxID=66852 RepID=UPI00386FCDC9